MPEKKAAHGTHPAAPHHHFLTHPMLSSMIGTLVCAADRKRIEGHLQQLFRITMGGVVTDPRVCWTFFAGEAHLRMTTGSGVNAGQKRGRQRCCPTERDLCRAR
jgi:hypothetical protein